MLILSSCTYLYPKVLASARGYPEATVCAHTWGCTCLCPALCLSQGVWAAFHKFQIMCTTHLPSILTHIMGLAAQRQPSLYTQRISSSSRPLLHATTHINDMKYLDASVPVGEAGW